ncbi:MAG: CPBP family intramembrane metalloprotease [Synechococcus sp. SB0668_bin_15]|nr:CPBP family intramembrane metalloprotease [Synechococcus sp. SB0668_bin_15]MYC49297.1 CPBP family intramembrane metalloprotease [Synechococcus sp. SB0662_bin_14]
MLFVPLLLALAWLLTRPLLWLGVDPGSVRLLVSLGAFVLFLVCLPLRLRRVWGIAHPWRCLGLNAPFKRSVRALVQGLLEAALLLLGLSLALLALGQARVGDGLTLGQTVNAAALMGVGFAEELVFRGWLWGELQLRLNRVPAVAAQAVVFSVLHTRFDQGWAIPLGLLPGMFMLGLVLAGQRSRDDNLLAGAVGLHGGLVTGWFALQSGLLSLEPSIPAWLVGPNYNPVAALPDYNPVGGLLGWLGLVQLLGLRWRWLWGPGAKPRMKG